ncbi:MAG: ABC transporter permease [Propionibacteriales bacterium]|nr:ABC transporter permease [Propionibacteriales bacterium]
MSAWRLSFNGLRTVVELELRQRVRSRRWIWALVGWFLLIGAVTTLVIWAASKNWGNPDTDLGPGGPMAFGLITYFVLGLGLMIAPAFTSTSINGDRAAGTLATLQATRLSALDLATGRLIAAWLTAAVFVLVATPFIAWSMVLGSISIWQVLVVFLVVLAEVAIVAAIGLGWSALLSRAAGAAAMTYISVIVLSVLTVVVFGLATMLTVSPQVERVWGLTPDAQDEYAKNVDDYLKEHPDAEVPPAPVDKCTWWERPSYQPQPEKVWWMLVANPFVVVADAAPLPPGVSTDLKSYQRLSNDPLAAVRYAVRSMAVPSAREVDECSSYYSDLPGYTVDWDADGNAVVKGPDGTVVNVSPVKRTVVNVESPIWPWGLGFHFLLGVVFFWVAVRRLSVPYGKLTPGTRVA